MDMAILDSDGGGGSDVACTTGGVPSVPGGAEDATSSIGPVEGTAGAGALMSACISTGRGSSRWFGYGVSRSFGAVGAPGCTS